MYDFMPPGYTIIMRTWPETEAKGDIIVWWQKGYQPDLYYKCEGESPRGFLCEGIGDTVEEALRNLVEEFYGIDECDVEAEEAEKNA